MKWGRQKMLDKLKSVLYRRKQNATVQPMSAPSGGRRPLRRKKRITSGGGNVYIHHHDDPLDKLVYTTLTHHGIPHQKWGERNGPPYPLSREVKSRVYGTKPKQKQKSYDDKTQKLVSKYNEYKVKREPYLRLSNTPGIEGDDYKYSWQVACFYEFKMDRLKDRIGKNDSQYKDSPIKGYREARNAGHKVIKELTTDEQRESFKDENIENSEAGKYFSKTGKVLQNKEFNDAVQKVKSLFEEAGLDSSVPYNGLYEELIPKERMQIQAKCRKMGQEYGQIARDINFGLINPNDPQYGGKRYTQDSFRAEMKAKSQEYLRKKENDIRSIGDSLSKEELGKITQGKHYSLAEDSVYSKVEYVDGKPAAFIELYRDEGYEKSQVSVNIATNPKYRGLGLTKKLVNAAIEEAPDEVKEIYWETDTSNKASSGLAKKMGFTKAEDYSEDDDNYVLYRPDKRISDKIINKNNGKLKTVGYVKELLKSKTLDDAEAVYGVAYDWKAMGNRVTEAAEKYVDNKLQKQNTKNMNRIKSLSNGGYTQAEIAKKLGISVSTVSRYLNK